MEPSELLFDLEDTELLICHKYNKKSGIHSSLEALVQRLELAGRQPSELARKLRFDVLQLHADLLPTTAPELLLNVLAAQLAGRGYDDVRIRVALGGGNECFSCLRHEFLIVRGTGEYDGMELIVEPALRAQFAIPHPSAAYAAAMAALPDVFVGAAFRLVPIVQTLCAMMAESFAAQGLALPPWRKEAAMLSKWMPSPSRLHDVKCLPSPRVRPGAAAAVAAAAPTAAAPSEAPPTPAPSRPPVVTTGFTPSPSPRTAPPAAAPTAVVASAVAVDVTALRGRGGAAGDGDSSDAFSLSGSCLSASDAGADDGGGDADGCCVGGFGGASELLTGETGRVSSLLLAPFAAGCGCGGADSGSCLLLDLALDSVAEAAEVAEATVVSVHDCPYDELGLVASAAASPLASAGAGLTADVTSDRSACTGMLPGGGAAAAAAASTALPPYRPTCTGMLPAGAVSAGGSSGGAGTSLLSARLVLGALAEKLPADLGAGGAGTPAAGSSTAAAGSGQSRRGGVERRPALYPGAPAIHLVRLSWPTELPSQQPEAQREREVQFPELAPPLAAAASRRGCAAAAAAAVATSPASTSGAAAAAAAVGRSWLPWKVQL